MFKKHYHGTISIDGAHVAIEDKNSAINFSLDSLISLTMKSEQRAHAQEMCCDFERVKIASPELADKVRVSVLTKEMSFTSTVHQSEADKLLVKMQTEHFDPLEAAIEESAAANPKLAKLLKKDKKESNYPFHIHFHRSDFDEENSEPPTAEELEKDRLEWKEMFLRPFIGTCELCREITALSRETDEHFLLCAACSQQIAADVKLNGKVKCDFCDSKFSRLLCETQTSGKIKCQMCLPNGICCRCEETKRLVSMTRDWRGMQLLCAECG